VLCRIHLRVATTAVAADTTQDRIGLDSAYRLLWLAVVFDTLAFGVGFGWDRSWHATHPFEDFFSPPHLFIYSMHLCATLTLAYVAFTPELRRWFGETFTLPLVPFPVPGPIALAGAGFVVTGLAGFFDGIWHTAFGLDETLWSFPHSMLGWGLMIAFLGITSCRLALGEWKPIGWGSAIVFGFLVFSSSIERVPGPFMNNISPEVVRFIAAIPVLAAEPAFQHTTRIYLSNDITRFSPLFVPLVGLGTGLAFGLLRRFDPRPLLVLGLGILLTRTTDFVPLIVPAVVVALRGSAAIGWRWWTLTGLCFGIATAIVWDRPFTLGGALLAAPLMAVGAAGANRIWRVVEHPSRGRVLTFVALAGIAAPAFTGVVDLALRARTP
jgi:hypothetical protein